MEPFVVKHYSADERPTIKGNGFDGLEIGKDREETERFVAFVNAAVAAERELQAEIALLKERCARSGVEARKAEHARFRRVGSVCWLADIPGSMKEARVSRLHDMPIGTELYATVAGDKAA